MRKNSRIVFFPNTILNICDFFILFSHKTKADF